MVVLHHQHERTFVSRIARAPSPYPNAWPSPGCCRLHRTFIHQSRRSHFAAERTALAFVEPSPSCNKQLHTIGNFVRS